MIQALAPIVLLAAAHMAIGWIASFTAGVSPSDEVAVAVAEVFLFPIEALPDAVLSSPARAYAAWAMMSLAWASLAVSLCRLGARRAGRWGARGVAAALVAIVVAAVIMRADPAPDWTQPGHRALNGHHLLLPQPFRESIEDRTADITIFRNLHPDLPYVPPATGRWYWNRSAGLAGHPTYDAVVVATPHSAASDMAAFRAILAQQRDPSWAAARWVAAAEGEGWVLETALPERAPVATGERDRLVRIHLTEPASGVWIGIVAIERKLPRASLITILTDAAGSVRRNDEGSGLPPQAVPAERVSG